MKGVGAYSQCASDGILINVAVNSDMLIYFAPCQYRCYGDFISVFVLSMNSLLEV